VKRVLADIDADHGFIRLDPPNNADAGSAAGRRGIYVCSPPGRRTVNTVPLPGSLVAVTSPPIMRAAAFYRHVIGWDAQEHAMPDNR
jgi:hypothetical protein